MKERIIAYDCIRVFAMLLVVASHSFGEVSNAGATTISLLSYLEAPCNGLFFAISGALLLPVKSFNVEFIGKRFTKIAVPTIFWSIVYLVLLGNISIKSVCSIPFSAQGAGIFWFIYTMVGLYLLSPVISPWLECVSKKTLQFYLSLWAITTCYPILENWLEINSTINGPLYYLSGYVGYFILGYYLKRYSVSFSLSAILFVFAIAVMIAVKLFFPSIVLYDRFWYLSVFCITGVVFYWKLIEHMAAKISWMGGGMRQLIITCLNLTFGVYFLHWGILKYIIPQFTALNYLPYLVSYLCRIAIAFIGALCLSYLISFLPGAQYIIGCKHYK